MVKTLGKNRGSCKPEVYEHYNAQNARGKESVIEAATRTDAEKVARAVERTGMESSRIASAVGRGEARNKEMFCA